MTELRAPRALALVWLPLLAVAALHYLTPPHMHWVHDVARRLYYLPIVAGAMLGGVRGGLLLGGLAVALYVPHAFGTHFGPDPGTSTEKLLELGFYLVLGGMSGWFVDRERAEVRQRVALDATLRERDAELARAARLQSLGELTAGLAHEIRNPLHAMRGTAEILIEAVPPQTEERRIGEGLIVEIDRLAGVLSRFLDFARHTEADLDDVALDGVALQVCDLVRAQASRQQTALRCEVPEVWARADRDRLVQVTLAVVLNALQAVAQGGMVCLGAMLEDDAVLLHIDNDGPPIPPELAGRLFDPFVSGREGGTGLGLSTAWRLIDAMGGEIAVAPREVGVRFVIRLQRAPRRQVAQRDGAAS